MHYPHMPFLTRCGGRQWLWRGQRRIMIGHQLPTSFVQNPDARESIVARNGFAFVYSDHRRAAGFYRGTSINPHANVGGRDRSVLELVRCEVGDDLCLVPNDAGWSDAEKVVGVDLAKGNRVGGDLRVNPVVVLLPNSLLRICGVGCLCARLLRHSGGGHPEQECSDDGGSDQGKLLVMELGASVLTPEVVIEKWGRRTWFYSPPPFAPPVHRLALLPASYSPGSVAAVRGASLWV